MNLPPLILLAGGKSARMGIPKGLLKKDGEYWIVRQLKNFAQAGGTKAVIVLGFDRYRYQTQIPSFKEGLAVERLNAEIVVNEKPERGQFSSIQIGVEQTISQTEAFLLPVDVPAPTEPFWSQLLAAHRAASGALVTIPTFRGQGGHPIVISQILMKKIIESPADSTRLDHLIHSLPAVAVNRVNRNESLVVLNLNDQEQWKQFT